MEDEPSPASGIEAFRDLERCLSGAVGGLAEIERESERRGREILRLALQAHIDARGDGDVGQAIVVVGEDGPVRLAHKRVHRRAVVTLFGEVSVTRVGYGAPGREAIHPLDAELMLPARVWSYECQRRLIRTVICGPFDEAIALIGEITGTTVPKRSAEQLVREAAVDFDSFYAARIGEAIEPPDGRYSSARSTARASRWSSPSARCGSCAEARARRPTRNGWRPSPPSTASRRSCAPRPR